MKMVKSLLLGSAAGLVAIAGAQAADLPVKAKPVEYVKICSAYGAGFYYIPGTDICLRVGGYSWIEAGYNERVGVPLIYNGNIGGNLILNRDDNRTSWRARGGLILDARTQTPAGTLRTYIDAGWEYNNLLGGASPPGNVGAFLNFAFAQWAGFTFGQANSFFSFGGWYSVMAPASVDWNWNPLFAYTANFGNGFSATLSIEDGQAHRTRLGAAGGDVLPLAAAPVNNYGGQEVPDIVGNLRVDQAWGSAQISGALHQLRVNQATATAGFADVWGYAILGGIEIKTPMIAPGDSITLQGVWSDGAPEYTGISTSPLASALGVGLVNNVGVGPATQIYDGYPSVVTGTVLKTRAWSAFGQFRHFWQPNLRSSLWVGYNRLEPANSLGFFNPPMDIYQVGLSTIWSPVTKLDLSLDLLYTNLRTGSCFGGVACAVGAPLVNITNQQADIFSIITRWRRDF